MKLVSFRHEGREQYGVAIGDDVVVMPRHLVDRYPTLKDVISAGALQQLRTEAEHAKATLPLQSLAYLPVIPNPEKIFGIGLNYSEHVQETKRQVATNPSMFLRLANTLVGHNSPMVAPKASVQFDFEGELAVVIGKPGRHIAQAQAAEHVFGYTCFIDGSVRDFQRESPTAGKNFWRSGPLGPCLLTVDEVPDVAALTLQTRLNGTVMQNASVGSLIHPIPKLISYISTFTPLEPGDIIATGTPAGVGHARVPPLWLKAGDVLEVEISRIGTLRNPVIAE